VFLAVDAGADAVTFPEFYADSCGQKLAQQNGSDAKLGGRVMVVEYE
jgi:hypothetical protein